MPSINVDYIAMAMIAVMGIIMIITNKPFLVRVENYTKESLAKYVRPAGLTYVLIGVFGFGFLYTLRLFFNEKISGWVTLACLALVIIIVIVNLVVIRKILVRK